MVDLAPDKTIAGLYFLRSDIDKSLMVLPGNALTDFRFHKASVQTSTNGALMRFKITQTLGEIADAEAVIEAGTTGEEAILPPFQSAHERERMLKYAPFGLSIDRSGHWLKVAEVQRDESEWKERPVRIRMADWRYLKRTIYGEARLVRATQVMPIDYRWCIGRMERL
jgi:Iap family predicted aminopeptidase